MGSHVEIICTLCVVLAVCGASSQNRLARRLAALERTVEGLRAERVKLQQNVSENSRKLREEQDRRQILEQHISEQRVRLKQTGLRADNGKGDDLLIKCRHTDGGWRNIDANVVAACFGKHCASELQSGFCEARLSFIPLELGEVGEESRPSYRINRIGWEVVFSAKAGSGARLLDVWNSQKPRNPRRPNADVYKSALVEKWGYRVFSLVKISVLKKGKEKAYFIFNGLLSTKNSWMSIYRLLASSSGGLLDETFRYFSIPGHDAEDRHFFIHKSYGGCGSDKGWLVVVDGDRHSICDWMNRAPKPYFLYCPKKAACNMNDALLGDQFVISVMTAD